jgi:hypothetical protein
MPEQIKYIDGSAQLPIKQHLDFFQQMGLRVKRRQGERNPKNQNGC